MSKIFITGGAGFIGFHLAKLLAQNGNDIIIGDNFSRGVLDKDLSTLLQKPNVTLRSINLLKDIKHSAMGDDFDYIYHLAAIVGVRHVSSKPYNVLKDNVDMLANTLEIARHQKRLKRFIFASTSEIYAGTLKYFNMQIPTPENTPLTVNDLKNPRSTYMLSKIYGEAMCIYSGLPYTIVRPHNFYGPRMGLVHVIPEMIKRIEETQNNYIDVFSPDHRRTFCYIDDAVQMIKLLAENERASGQTFNIGVQNPEISILDLIELIIRIMNKKLQLRPQGAVDGSPPRRCPDISRAFDLTGYNPAVNLDEGIKQTYGWYRNMIENDDLSAV